MIHSSRTGRRRSSHMPGQRALRVNTAMPCAGALYVKPDLTPDTFDVAGDEPADGLIITGFVRRDTTIVIASPAQTTVSG